MIQLDQVIPVFRSKQEYLGGNKNRPRISVYNKEIREKLMVAAGQPLPPMIFELSWKRYPQEVITVAKERTYKGECYLSHVPPSWAEDSELFGQHNLSDANKWLRQHAKEFSATLRLNENIDIIVASRKKETHHFYLFRTDRGELNWGISSDVEKRLKTHERDKKRHGDQIMERHVFFYDNPDRARQMEACLNKWYASCVMPHSRESANPKAIPAEEWYHLRELVTYKITREGGTVLT